MANRGVELIYSTSNTGQFSRKFVRDGVSGNYAVVTEMVRITKRAVNYNRTFEKLVKDFIISKGLDSYSKDTDIFNAIYNFVHSRVKYVLDAAGKVENIKSPTDTLSDGFGDCDDLAIVCASMLGVLGFEDVRFCMARYAENEPSFVHIYTVCYEKGKRFVFDATLPNGKLNDEVKAFEKREVAIFNETETLTLSGFLYEAKRAFRGASKTAIRALPTATQFLPIGFFSGAALATSANILTNNAEQKLSASETVSKINRQLDKIIIELRANRLAFDMAKNYASQVAIQINTIDINSVDSTTYNILKNSIKEKLDWIADFPQYAQTNNIQLVNLDSNKMLLASIGGLAIGGYAVYKAYQNSRD